MDVVLDYGAAVPFVAAAFFWAKGLRTRRGGYLSASGALIAAGIVFHLLTIRYTALPGLPWTFLLALGAAATAAGALRRGDPPAMRREIAAGAACLVLAGVIFAGQRVWLRPANSILVIAPYRRAGTWVFDDPRAGLRAEPFVAGVPELMDRLVADIPGAEKGFRLLFSAAPFPGHATRLVWRRREGVGNRYYSEDFDMEGWLCPALFEYFPRAPREIYIKAEPLTGEPAR